jgi:hypothetical protein
MVPVSPFCFVGCFKQGFRSEDDILFLKLWFAAMFVFFSISISSLVSPLIGANGYVVLPSRHDVRREDLALPVHRNRCGVHGPIASYDHVRSAVEP